MSFSFIDDSMYASRAERKQATVKPEVAEVTEGPSEAQVIATALHKLTGMSTDNDSRLSKIESMVMQLVKTTKEQENQISCQNIVCVVLVVVIACFFLKYVLTSSTTHSYMVPTTSVHSQPRSFVLPNTFM